MNIWEMILGIVLVGAVVSIVRALADRGRADAAAAQPDPDAARMRDEIRALRERIAVLERIATENDRGLALDREIERLRDRH